MNLTPSVILEKCGWTSKQIEYCGTLIRKAKSESGKLIAEVVSRRSEDFIIVDWIPKGNQDEKISLTYSVSDNRIDFSKTDPGIADDESALAFLDGAERIVKDSKTVFLPLKKTEAEPEKRYSPRI